MLESYEERGTPEWWLLRLGRRMVEEQKHFDLLERYWVGNPPVPFGNQKMREAYKRLQRLARTNFGSLVAEAILERLKIVGFRAGADSTDEADKAAWKWWQQNSLDADSGLVHRAAVVFGRAYVIVGEDPDEPGQPLVTGEDPRQVIHESSPTNRRKVVAALKTWWDPSEEQQYAVLYTPETIYYFRSTAKVNKDTPPGELWMTNSWESGTEDDDTASVENPLGVVPVVPFVNRPDMAGNGHGEFEDVLDILDRINTVILDRLVISAMQAYRQRWAKGVDLTDEQGNASTSFDPGADLLWAVPSDNAQFGEFNPTDLTPIVKAIESDVSYLSAVTRTPPHYILAGIVNASGDALSVAETGLVSKVRERMTEYGESWEQVYRLVAKLQGKEIDADAEVLWRDPQFRTLAELAAASVQLKAADVPWRTRMRLLDMTPLEIERMEAERAHDAMLAMIQAQQAAMAGLPPGEGAPGPGGNPAITPGDVTPPEGSTGPAGGTAATSADTPYVKGQKNLVGGDGGRDVSSGSTGGSDGDGGAGASGSSGGKSGGGDGGTNLSQVSWDVLYQRAKAAGIKGAALMTKAQLAQLVGL